MADSTQNDDFYGCGIEMTSLMEKNRQYGNLNFIESNAYNEIHRMKCKEQIS